MQGNHREDAAPEPAGRPRRTDGGHRFSPRSRTEIRGLPPLVFLLLFVVFSTGCVGRPDYSYPGIRQEYAEAIRRAAPLSEREGKAVTFAVDRPIGLTEAIDIALSNNPEKRMAIARIRRAEARIQKAMAAFYPALSFYTEYTEGDAPSAYLFKKIDQRELPPDANFNDPGRIENFESGLKARWNLFNGGRDYLRKRMAETGRTLAEIGRRTVENGLVASVISAYYNALAARDFIDIARDSVRTVETQLRIMRVRFEAGGALKSDILSLEVRLAEARQSVVESRNSHRTALAALAQILGIGPHPLLRLEKGADLSLPLPDHYLGGIAHALDHRPELAKVRQQVIRSRLDLARARAGRLPRVDVQGKYYLDDESMAYDFDRDNWTVGMVLNWDIFTGFSTRAEAREAEAALEEMLSADRRTSLSVKTEVKNAYLDLEAATARLRVAEASVANAEESLDLVKKQYEGGSASITRYLNAELDRNRARTRAAAAFYDREKARAEVARAVGYWAKVPSRQPLN